MSESESKGAVIAAMAANAGIAVAKGTVGVLTHSSSLLAEAGHSVADTGNQVLLLIGVRLSDNEADDRHPHGYGKETFFWSFLVAVLLFGAGATFSIYEGVRTLFAEHHDERTRAGLLAAYAVLAVAFVFEAASFTVAVRASRTTARRESLTFGGFLRDSPQLTTKTVFWEDSAALVGLLLAALGLTMSTLTENEAWDGVASICIGILLAGVAFVLGLQAKALLIGSAASPVLRDRIRDAVLSFEEVNGFPRLLTMQTGTRSILVTGEVNVRPGLTTSEIEDLLNRVDLRVKDAVPDVSDSFWEIRRAADQPTATSAPSAKGRPAEE